MANKLPMTMAGDHRGAEPYQRKTPMLEDDPKHKMFVLEYLRDLNQSAAAVRAGYKASSAPRLMKIPVIARAIEVAQAERALRYDLTADRLAAKLAMIINSDRRELFRADGSVKPPGELTEEQAALVEAVKVRRYVELGADGEMQQAEIQEVKLVGMLPAITLAMKHKGMLVERHEVTINENLTTRLQNARQRVVAASIGVTLPEDKQEAVDVEFEDVTPIPSLAEMLRTW